MKAPKLTAWQREVIDLPGVAELLRLFPVRVSPLTRDDIERGGQRVIRDRYRNLALCAAVGLVEVMCIDDGGHWYLTPAGEAALRGAS